MDAVEKWMKISDKDGEILVHMAREAIEKYIQEELIMEPPSGLNKGLYENMGVFVTLKNSTPNGPELRGCIGHPLPDKPLVEAIIDSAISAASKDPRFEKVTLDELYNIIVEVSVLTPPERISVSSPEEYIDHIKIGVDGLIVRWKYGSGLLLPQVPIEQGWGIEEFLNHTCLKAGVTSDHWRNSDIDIYKFKGIVFDEITPRGKVFRRNLV